MCDDPKSPGDLTFVCFAYPKAKFQDYPTFEAATFSAGQTRDEDMSLMRLVREALSTSSGSIAGLYFTPQ